MNPYTKYPNQIDSINTEPKEALIAIENTLGTNPQGLYSTVNDRLAALDKDLKSLIHLSSIDYLSNLNLATILSLGGTTDGYDLILGPGDSIVGSDGFINLKGNTSINGTLETLGNIDLNNHYIKNVLFPIDPHDVSNKEYVDNQISAQNSKLIDSVNKIIKNDNNLIQYTKGKSDPLPESEPNKYLKRNIDNSAWEFSEIDLKPLYNKIDELNKLIKSVSKNETNGSDITVNVGDAIKGEDGFLNIDAEVIIHKGLSIGGNLDAEYHRIINIPDPQNPKDAINKQYVDDRIPKNIVISDTLDDDANVYYKDGMFKCNYLRLGSTKNIIINGIKFPDKGTEFVIINVGENFITLKHKGNVDFGNYFELVNEVDFVLTKNASCKVMYDFDSSFWRIVGDNKA